MFVKTESSYVKVGDMALFNNRSNIGGTFFSRIWTKMDVQLLSTLSDQIFIKPSTKFFKAKIKTSTNYANNNVGVYELVEEVSVKELSELLPKEILANIYSKRCFKELVSHMLDKYKNDFDSPYPEDFVSWVIKKGGTVSLAKECSPKNAEITSIDYSRLVRAGVIHPLDVRVLTRVIDIHNVLLQLEPEDMYIFLKNNPTLLPNCYSILDQGDFAPDFLLKLLHLFDKDLLYSYDLWWAYVLDDNSKFPELLIKCLYNKIRVKSLLDKGVTWESVGLDGEVMNKIYGF